jgi:hypothetical protein
MLPHWQRFFDHPMSEATPGQRADKARRYKNEAPEKHQLLAPLWKGAVRDVKARKVWSNKELRLAFPDKMPTTSQRKAA